METTMRYLSALALTLAALGTAQAAEIYCNNQGRDCSDKPSPGATTVRISSANFGTNTLSAPASGSERLNNATGQDFGADARLEQERNAQALQKDLTATHARQCKEAQDKYQKAIEARRVYRMGKDGEREYLSDTEAGQMRLNARVDMERSCGKTSG
jgi:hypothetical protein